MAATPNSAKPIANKPASTPNTAEVVTAQPSQPVAAKKPKKSKAALIVFLFFFVILAAGFGAYYFNLFGFKNMVINFFITQDSTYTAVMTRINTVEAELTNQSNSLNETSRQLTEASKTIDAANAQLTERQAAVEKRERDLTAAQAEFEKKTFEFDQLVSMYKNMDVKKAADALSKVTNKDTVIYILLELEEKQASNIMAAFDPWFAAQITARMNTLAKQ